MSDSQATNEASVPQTDGLEPEVTRVKRYRRRKPGLIQRIVGNRWFVKGSFFLIFVIACVQLMSFAARMMALAPSVFGDQNKLFAAIGWMQMGGSPAMSGLQPPTGRPEVVAGILPVGHYTSFFAWLKGGGWDTLLPAGLVIIIGAWLLSVFLKRGFCGWICPLGTFWEAWSALGRKLFGRNIKLPKWLDYAFRAIRYAIAFMFFFWLASVSIQEATGFRTLPYMFIADIKIIKSFMTPPFLIAFGTASVLTLFFSSFWCRYLCPLGGLYGPMSTVSPCTICRDEELCIDCNKCNETCHAFIDVANSKSVRSPECDGCMDCVHVCPVQGAVEMKVAGRWTIPAWTWPLLVAGVWLLVWTIAKVTGNWDTTVPQETFAFALSTVEKSKGLDLETMGTIVKMLFAK